LVDFYNLDLLSLANTKYFISPVELDDPDLELLPSQQRDEFIKWEKRKNTERLKGALKGEWSHRPIYIYENTRCLPRFFLVKNVRVYEEEHSLVYALRYQSADSFLSTMHMAIDDIPADVDLSSLERSTAEPDESAFFPTGNVEVVRQSSDRIELKVNAQQRCMLFLANTYHPGWRAQIDGQAVPILPANHTFQGVPIFTPGEHRVVLTYSPSYVSRTLSKALAKSSAE
jgi:hypothetical protein